MKKINEGSRSSARLARLTAARDKAMDRGDVKKARAIGSLAPMRQATTAPQTKQALRGGATLKQAKATKSVTGKVKDYKARSAAIANFAATSVIAKSAAKKPGKGKKVNSSVRESVNQLDEAGQARLFRLKGLAYKAGKTGSEEHGKLMRAAAEREDQEAARKAFRGGAGPDAVRAAGNPIGKRGKPTLAAQDLKQKRANAIHQFHANAKASRAKETGAVLGGGELSPAQVADKRKKQKQFGKFDAVRTGRDTFHGKPEDPARAAAEMRPRYNWAVTHGSLKGRGLKRKD